MDELSVAELLEIIDLDGEYEALYNRLSYERLHTTALEVLHLQQDAGLELDPSFDPDNLSNPPGPSTKALWKAYQPVTKARCEMVLQAAKAALQPPPHTPEL